MRNSYITGMLRVLSVFLIAGLLTASEVGELFKGRDSGPLRGLGDILLKAAPLDSSVQALDVILETEGIPAARKAQNYIKDYPMDPISTWMLLVLADFYMSDGKTNTALNLLEKAKTRDEVIIHDVYYRLLSSRLEGKLISSPGLTASDRPTALSIDLQPAKHEADARGLMVMTDPDLPGVPLPSGKRPGGAAVSVGKYHLQVGAFSERVNSDRIVNLFKENGYPVQIRERSSDGRLIYIVWVGNYPDRNEALLAGESIEKKFSVKSFVVTDP